MDEERLWRRVPNGAIFGALVVTYAAVAIFLSLFAMFNDDEGFYLYISRFVYEGNIPYRDFSFTQTPLMPYVYGLVERLLGFGLWGGRLTSVVFNVLSLVLAIQTARRWGPLAVLVTAGLLAANFLGIQFMTFISTFPLASFLTMVAVWSFLSGKAAFRWTLVTVIASALAVATRLSLVPVFVLLGGGALLSARREPRKLMLAAGVALIALAPVLVPFLLWRDNFIFNVWGHHMTQKYEAISGLGSGLVSVFGSKMRFIEGAIRNDYFTVVLIAIGGLFLISVYRAKAARCLLRQPRLVSLGLAVLGVSLIHFASGEASSGYQFVLLPMTATLAGIVFGSAAGYLAREQNARRFALSVVFAALALSPFGFSVDWLGFGGGETVLASNLRGSQLRA